MDPVIVQAASYLMAAIFAAGARDKLREPAVFAAVVEGYGLLPTAVSGTVARVLGWAEAAIAGALLWPVLWPLAQFAGLLLLGLVTIAVVINLLRGRVEIDCGCGGASADQELSWALVLRNIGLAALLALPWLAGSPRPMAWLDRVTVGVAVVAGFGLYAAANQLLANAPRLRRLAEGSL